MKQQKQYPLMSIVVLNWNGLEDTKICLEHLRQLDYPNYEIIVVDNGSKPEQKAYLRKIKDIILVDNPVNKGFTGGHIDGLAHSKGEYIVLLNNDAVMQRDYLKKALENFTDPTVAAVGGRSYFWDDDNLALDENNAFYSYQNVNIFTGEAFMQQTDYNTPQSVNNVSGSAVVMRRSVINEIGYLYDRFFAYFEETDLFARVKRAGYKVLYDPQLHIWHRNGASSGASSGSYFFYYQIFRNRFIFAMRNFELSFLLRFLYVYTRIATDSLARLLLRPHSPNRTMYKAYSRAAWYNLLTLPRDLHSRRLLRRQLGKSNYNHLIYLEQTGVSFVFDCTAQSAKQVTALRKQLAADRNPLHEYVLVVQGEYPPDFASDQPNLRFVVDRGFFASNPLNLGCLAARFDWMALCPSDIPVPHEHIDAAVASTLRTSNKVVALGDGQSYAAAVLLHKDLFVRMGGLHAITHAKLSDQLIAYAQLSKHLGWYDPHDASLPTVPLTSLTASQKKHIDTAIRQDKVLAEQQRMGWFGRFLIRHYRVYQATCLFKWLFIPKISLYLKAARIKNLLLFAATLKRQALATELKHIRNEAVINTRRGVDIDQQNKACKQRLTEQLERPQDIPVFIICRDRIDSMKTLVAWLEKRGLHKIVFIDNDSVYPPLVQFFHDTKYQVLKLYRNVGHTSPWTLGMIRTLIPHDAYIVSDPDVIPSEECPKDVLTHFLELHQQHFMYQKVGFGLRIDDLPDHYPLKQQVIEWEGQFWKQELEPHVYEAGVDTTFALYKPYTYHYMLHPSIRTGFPYTARHLPWYLDPAKITAEETHYRMRMNRNVSSWNVDVLEDRYAKEMKTSRFKKKTAGKKRR